MQTAAYNFAQRSLEILAIGDLHIGSEGSYYAKAISAIEKYPDAKLVLLGDLIDNAVIGSLGDVYSQTDNPQGTLFIVSTMLRKYKSRILGIVAGNHEQRTWKRVGIDPVRLLAESENIPYSSDLLIIDISLTGDRGRGTKHRTNYVIACHHGAAGGRFPERAARQQRYFSDMVVGADIYITGHVHIPNVMKTASYEYDPHNKKIYKRNVHHVTIPAWTDESYATQKMLPPTADANVLITLYAGYTKTVSCSIT